MRIIPVLTASDVQRFWSHVDIRDLFSCWEWKLGLDAYGYGYITIQYKQYKTHRISYLLEHGEFPPEMHVLHSCDNRKCQNPAHLFLGTNQDNILDRVGKGRSKEQRGEMSVSAKLTNEDVLEIRRILDEDHTLGRFKRLADRYGVASQTIESIYYRRKWSHI